MIRAVSVGSVAQSLAANTHGYALVTEADRFGLAVTPAFANGEAVKISMFSRGFG